MEKDHCWNWNQEAANERAIWLSVTFIDLWVFFFRRNLNLHVWNMKLCIEQCQALSKLSNLAPQCILLLLRPQTHVWLAFAATERKRWISFHRQRLNPRFNLCPPPALFQMRCFIKQGSNANVKSRKWELQLTDKANWLTPNGGGTMRLWHVNNSE